MVTDEVATYPGPTVTVKSIARCLPSTSPRSVIVVSVAKAGGVAPPPRKRFHVRTVRPGLRFPTTHVKVPLTSTTAFDHFPLSNAIKTPIGSAETDGDFAGKGEGSACSTSAIVSSTMQAAPQQTMI